MELTTYTNNYCVISKKKANIDTPAPLLINGLFSHPSTTNHEVATHLCQSHHEGMMSTPKHQQAQLSPAHQLSHSWPYLPLRSQRSWLPPSSSPLCAVISCFPENGIKKSPGSHQCPSCAVSVSRYIISIKDLHHVFFGKNPISLLGKQ